MIYIISLPTREDRREKMKRRMAFHGFVASMEYEFVDAFTPESPEVLRLGQGSNLELTRLNPELKCSIGREYACFASHLEALRRIIETGKSGIVIEDDALLRVGIKDFLTVNDPIWISQNIPLVMLYVEPNSQAEGIYDINMNWGAVGYWISNTYAIEAYDKYHRQFSTLSGFRTSECITIYSKGKYCIPQQLLEDPINLSNLRDTTSDSNAKNFHMKIDTYLNWYDYTASEGDNYTNLFNAYMSSLKGDDIYHFLTIVKPDELDVDQKYFYYTLASSCEKFLDYNPRIVKDLDLFYRTNMDHFWWNRYVDPFTDPIGNPDIIKKHLAIADKVGFAINGRNDDYLKLLKWYIDFYRGKDKYIPDINVNNLRTNEKVFYYDLVIINGWTVNKELGRKACGELLKLNISINDVHALNYFNENMKWYVEDSGKKRILIIADSILDYNPDSINTGIFGSEEAVIYMADILSKRYQVDVYNRRYTPNIYTLEFNNPRYMNAVTDIKYDIGILWRSYADIRGLCKKVYSWHHDMTCFPNELIEKVDGMFLLSNFQKEHYSKNLILKNPLICGNGLVPAQFSKPRTCTNKYSFVYTSCYDRGLIHLLKMWPEIKEKFPSATLDLCYGWTLWTATDDERADLKETFECVKHLDVTDHEMVGHYELIDIMLRSSIWAYPCRFLETFCITAIKMQACGVVPVVVNIGALKETVAHGHIVGSIDSYKKCLFNALENIDYWTDARRDAIRRDTISKWGWENVARVWESEFDKPDVASDTSPVVASDTSPVVASDTSPVVASDTSPVVASDTSPVVASGTTTI
jgi:hypothetical protein